jgi:hypothetical protein
MSNERVKSGLKPRRHNSSWRLNQKTYATNDDGATVPTNIQEVDEDKLSDNSDTAAADKIVIQ